jgi:hypothetical protein
MGNIERASRPQRGAPIPPAVREKLLARIERDGLAETSRTIGIARAATAAAAAGLPVLHGTGVAIAVGLENEEAAR